MKGVVGLWSAPSNGLSQVVRETTKRKECAELEKSRRAERRTQFPDQEFAREIIRLLLRDPTEPPGGDFYVPRPPRSPRGL
jgi:hypothetical protein